MKLSASVPDCQPKRHSRKQLSLSGALHGAVPSLCCFTAWDAAGSIATWSLIRHLDHLWGIKQLKSILFEPVSAGTPL